MTLFQLRDALRKRRARKVSQGSFKTTLPRSKSDSMVSIKVNEYTFWGDSSAIFIVLPPFSVGVNSNRKEFAPLGSPKIVFHVLINYYRSIIRTSIVLMTMKI